MSKILSLDIKGIFILILMLGANIIHGFCQEEIIVYTDSGITTSKNTKLIINNAIEAIDKIKNVKYISENKSTVPYLPTVYNDPFIAKMVVTASVADTVQGANFQFYLLKDSFEIRSVYDGENYLKFIDGKKSILSVSDYPYIPHSFMGSLHLKAQTILENAISRNAEIKVKSTQDSLKVTVVFKDLQIEFNPRGNARIAKDSIGFNSLYSVYLDPHTYLPIKTIRRMPYQTSIETILYQNINFTDSLIISALDSTYYDSYNVNKDCNLLEQITNTLMPSFNLMEVDGDSISIHQQGRATNSIIVFNSVGWKPCEDAVFFLKEFRNRYNRNELELIIIEPYINNLQVLRNYKQSHEMNYPLLLADTFIKKTFPIDQVPVFLFIDKDGYIRNVISGFNENTGMEILKAFEKL